MTIEEFKNLHESFLEKKPKIFLLVAPDQCATAEQIEHVESKIGVTLPRRYREFLSEAGGGTFGFTNIFSADQDSEFFLPTRRAKAMRYLAPDLLPFSDDFAGGYYVLQVTDGRAADEVFYWNADGGLRKTGFCDVLEFVARYAYEAA